MSGLFSYIVHIYEKAAYELQEEQIAIAFARAFDLPARHKLPRSKKKNIVDAIDAHPILAQRIIAHIMKLAKIE